MARRTLDVGRAGRLLLVGALAASPASADEGFWRPQDVPARAAALKQAGLQVNPAELARLDGLLSSVVDLGGCTGAFVSSEGLIVTAFHCASSALQAASREGEDLFEAGFSAGDRAGERPAPGMDARFTVAVEDVTLDMQASTRRLEGRAKLQQMQKNEANLVQRCEAGTGHVCRVVTDDQGGTWHLVHQVRLQDLRLVYAPPRAVGYFGGEADNWKWPRHSGDFAFLRAYAAPDGRPAEFSTKNVPYTPAHHLEVATTSPEPGALVAAATYPALSWRWRSAAELEAVIEDGYPRAIAVNRELLAVLDRVGAIDPTLAPKLAPRALSLSNDAVYLEGNLAGFERTRLLDRKRAFEGAMASWIESDPSRLERFGDVLETIEGLVGEARSTAAQDAAITTLIRTSDMLRTAMALTTLAEQGRKKDVDRWEGYRNRDRPDLEAMMTRLDTGYRWPIDRALVQALLLRALKAPESDRPPALVAWLDDVSPGAALGPRVEAALNRLYSDSTLTDPATRRHLMEATPGVLMRTGNPWFTLAEALYPTIERQHERDLDRAAAWRAVRQRYLDAVEAFVAAHPEHRITDCPWYPDANDTLRLSFGHVRGYEVRDGLVAQARTTVEGVLEKSGEAPYDVPGELARAIGEGRFEPYASNGALAVDFVSDLDTARGSSGGPTLDAKGRFVGIVFDGNENGMHADWVFDPRARTVHTDVAYVLWYLDAVAGARDLLRELGVKPSYATVAAGG